MMGQTATPLIQTPETAANLLSQGITTINAGEGVSAAPQKPGPNKATDWRTMREYLARLDDAGMPINVVQSVGHTQVRKLVLGELDRRPTPQEMHAMEDQVREAMQAGADIKEMLNMDYHEMESHDRRKSLMQEPSHTPHPTPSEANKFFGPHP